MMRDAAMVYAILGELIMLATLYGGAGDHLRQRGKTVSHWVIIAAVALMFSFFILLWPMLLLKPK